jgi:hypothetical protein
MSCEALSQSPLIRWNSLLPPVPRQFPDEALASEFTVELGIKAVTTVIQVEALTALLTKCRFMLLTDGDGFSVWVVFTLHGSSPFIHRNREIDTQSMEDSKTS